MTRTRAAVSLATLALGLLWTSLAAADPCKFIPDRGRMPASLHRGATFGGPVRYIGDGDSLCVGESADPNTWIEIRLSDFYAPELHELGGPEAKRDLQRLVTGQSLTCVAEHQSYDRVVASCTLGGRDLGDLLRASGTHEGGRAYPPKRGGR